MLLGLGRRASTRLAACCKHHPSLAAPLPHSGAPLRFTTPSAPNAPHHALATVPNAMGRPASSPGGGAAAAPPPDAELLAKAVRIRSQLDALYPDPAIPLEHRSPFQLLVAVMLSAQTTDKKVNEVTPALFALAPDAPAMAAASVEAIRAIIQPIGLAPTKAKNLQGAAAMLVERHQGQVPSTFEELEALPGVGHKTASVVMAQAFGLPAFPVDTHIHRLAQRWGLTRGNGAGTPTVEATERDLKALWPPEAWHDLHLQIIYFGREHCPAQRHDPTGCPICSWAAVPPYDRPGVSPAKAAGNKAPGGTKPAPTKGTKSAASRAAAAIAAAAPPAETAAAVAAETAAGSIGRAKAAATTGKGEKGSKGGGNKATEEAGSMAVEEVKQTKGAKKAAAAAADGDAAVTARGRKRRAPQQQDAPASAAAAAEPAGARAVTNAAAELRGPKRGRRGAVAAVVSAAAVSPADDIDAVPVSDQAAPAAVVKKASRSTAARRAPDTAPQGPAVGRATRQRRQRGSTAAAAAGANGVVTASEGGALAAKAAAGGPASAPTSLDAPPPGLVGNVFATFRNVLSSFRRQ